MGEGRWRAARGAGTCEWLLVLRNACRRDSRLRGHRGSGDAAGRPSLRSWRRRLLPAPERGIVPADATLVIEVNEGRGQHVRVVFKFSMIRDPGLPWVLRESTLELSDAGSSADAIRLSFAERSPGSPAALLLVSLPADGLTFAADVLSPPQDNPSWRTKACDVARFVADVAALAGAPARILAVEDAWYEAETPQEENLLSRMVKMAYNDLGGGGFLPYFDFRPEHASWLWQNRRSVVRTVAMAERVCFDAGACFRQLYRVLDEAVRLYRISRRVGGAGGITAATGWSKGTTRRAEALAKALERRGIKTSRSRLASLLQYRDMCEHEPYDVLKATGPNISTVVRYARSLAYRVLGVSKVPRPRRGPAVVDSTHGLALIASGRSAQMLPIRFSIVLDQHISVQLSRVHHGWEAGHQDRPPGTAEPVLITVNLAVSRHPQGGIDMVSEAVAFTLDVLDLSGYRTTWITAPGSRGAEPEVSPASPVHLSHYRLRQWWHLKPFVEHAANAQRLGESCQALIEWCRAFESLSPPALGGNRPQAGRQDERKVEALKKLGVRSPQPTPDLLARMRLLEDSLAHGSLPRMAPQRAPRGGAAAIQSDAMACLQILRAWAQQLLASES